MAFGHTDDVPNSFDLEAQPTPESSAVLHDEIESLATLKLQRTLDDFPDIF
ncbi:MAG: hypothetical protein ACKVH8_06520 [Pirellulales bacterium]